MKYWKLASIAIVLVFSSHLNASVLSIDWQTADDNLITRDTSSGLEWLDLTVTRSLSFDTVSSRIATVGDELYGWRYASSSQLDTLLWNWGLIISSDHPIPYRDGISYGAPDLNQSLTDDVINTLGDTRNLDLIENRIFYEDVEAYSAYGFLGEQLRPGEIWIANINDQDYRGYSGYDRVALHANTLPSFGGAGYVGSFLIRDTTVVPIPAAVWLFGSGLISLVGFARRKKA